MADEPIVVEHYTSGQETVDDTGGEAELFYNVLQCDSPLAARKAVAKAAPPVYHKLGRGKMELTPIGAGMFAVKVKYNDLVGKISINFDYMAEKSKTVKAKETIANIRVRYGPNYTDPAPDYGNLIGVSHEKVEGVEIYEADGGTGKITMQWTTKYSNFTPDYIAVVKGLRGYVNNEPLLLTYKGQEFEFERGSLVFAGGTFHDSTDGSCDVTFKFEERESESTIRAGDLDGATVATFDGTITTDNDVVMSIASTSLLRAGMLITGAGIQAGTVIQEVLDATSIEMSLPATLDGVVSLTAKNPYLPTKEGWWYVWIRTAKIPVPTTRVQVDVPDSAHMVRVYDYADFTPLEVFDVINLQQVEDIERPALPPSDQPYVPGNLDEEQQEEEDEHGYRPLPPGFGDTGGPIQGGGGSTGVAVVFSDESHAGINDETDLYVNGTGFETTPGNNIITFNLGATGHCTAATSTTMTIRFDIAPGTPFGNGQTGPLMLVVRNSNGTSAPTQVLVPL